MKHTPRPAGDSGPPTAPERSLNRPVPASGEFGPPVLSEQYRQRVEEMGDSGSAAVLARKRKRRRHRRNMAERRRQQWTAAQAAGPVAPQSSSASDHLSKISTCWRP